MRHTRQGQAPTRRQALQHLTGVLGAAALGAVACQPGAPSPPPAPQRAQENGMTQAPPAPARMPVVFLPHGGGPWPFMDERVFGAPGMWDPMRAYMERLSMVPPARPRAVLVISAHWEAPAPTVMAAPRPSMLYDYSGFPPETYRLEWPAPGHPELAEQIRAALESAGIATAADAARGFDHGVFVPLKLAWPQADVPTLQLSLKRGLDPKAHFEIGRALAPLRDDGVFIVGSGMSYHNLRQLGRAMRGDTAKSLQDSRAFDAWLAETIDLGPSQREQRLIEWERAPAARDCHPREEHLLPLMVVAGAAGDAKGALPYRDTVMHAHVSAAHFG